MLYITFSFFFKIVHMVEDDIHQCGPQLSRSDTEEGKSDKCFSFVFLLHRQSKRRRGHLLLSNYIGNPG